jgi:hypothetical protein
MRFRRDPAIVGELVGSREGKTGVVQVAVDVIRLDAVAALRDGQVALNPIARTGNTRFLFYTPDSSANLAPLWQRRNRSSRRATS